MHKTNTLLKWNTFFFIAALGILVSSCEEKISGIGSTYLRDTISSGKQTFSDSGAFVFSPIIKRTAIASGRNFAINTAASALLLGKVSKENLECWTALKVPILPDSIGQIMADTLILRMRFAYHYGDPSDQNIDFSVYTETGTKVNDSTSNLSLPLGQVIGSYKGTVRKDTIIKILIPLDTQIINPLLRTASLALVLVPNSGMNTIRAFASNENGDNTFQPQLKFTINGPSGTTTIFRYPTNDFHVVISDQPIPGGEFLLRGSYAARERIVIDIKNIKAALQLNPFVTINSALLEVRSDPQYHTMSNVPIDTLGPALAYIPNGSVGDSGHIFIDYGSHSSADPDLYTYQIRKDVENALRAGSDSLVVELRAGFAYRTIAGSSVDVEDYNIDRWVFFGTDYADKTKSPKLVITYSYLR